MRQLSAQGDIGRVKGDIPATVYIRYVKACGVLAAIATLSISIIAQVRLESSVLAFRTPLNAHFTRWYADNCTL